MKRVYLKTIARFYLVISAVRKIPELEYLLISISNLDRNSL